MRQLIAGNWKMHGLKAELREIEAVAAVAARVPPHVEILICPPASLLADAARTAAGRIAVGGQDCHPEVSGAIPATFAPRCSKMPEQALSSSDIRSGASITAKPTPSSPKRL